MNADDWATIVGLIVIGGLLAALLWMLGRPDPRQPTGEPPHDGDGDAD